MKRFVLEIRSAAWLRCALALAILLSSSVSALAEPVSKEGPTAAELDAIMRFEVPSVEGQPPVGWGGGPPATLQRDEGVVHTGTGAARIVRNASSDGDFSALTHVIEADFVGTQIELRGFLKTAEVDGGAGLWLRQDASSGALQFVSMLTEGRPLSGTTDWERFAISASLDTKAQRIFLGVVLGGTGTTWVDDLEILVDGKPLAAAPKRAIETTVLDTDREFEDGSGIEIDALTPQQVEHLAVLGQVWGFLKYHHPRVAQGALHWDYALLRAMPSVLMATDAVARNRALVRWIDEIGVPTSCDPCAEAPGAAGTDALHLAPDIEWIHDREMLGPALVERLEAVWKYRFAGDEQFYLSRVHGVGNPVFENELPYRGMQPPDAGFRLLSLFRLWNIVTYWFPYRDLIDDDWPTVLRSFVPRLVAARDWDDYRRTLLALIARIKDTHANLWGALDVLPPQGACRWPVALRSVEDRFVVTAHLGEADPEESPFEIGDAIVGFGGRPVAEWVAEWSPYYAASNRITRLRDIARFMPRGACGPSQVEIDRRGKRVPITAVRIPGIEETFWPHDRAGATFQRLSPPTPARVGEIAYLKLSSVKINEIDTYFEEAAGTHGWVIDIRNYPSAFVVFALGERLVDSPSPFARFTVGDPRNPGAFRWRKSVSVLRKTSKVGETPGSIPMAPRRYEGPIAILVDESSISQAEYTAMAFSVARRAVVVGSTTAAADGNVSPIPLPGGLGTAISGIGVFYPDRRPTQRVGIVPDIVARPTIEGIREGRDEVLEVAIRHLLGADVDPAVVREMARRPSSSGDKNE